jgi:hypothetical protein
VHEHGLSGVDRSRAEPERGASPSGCTPALTGTCRLRVLPARAWSWAALMHRAFAIDVLACPHCGGRLRFIATLHDPAMIRKLLAHLGMARSGPEPGPAPPES